MYDNSTELTHYGVKGMRWGVRSASYYDKRVAANLKRASTAKSGYAKMRAKNRAEVNKYYADRARRISKAKTLKDRIMVDYGTEDSIKAMQAYTNIEKNKAAASKTKLMRQVHKVNAANNEAYTDVHRNVNKAKGVKNKVTAAVTGIAKLKTTNLSGRKVGWGEQIVESYLPAIGLMRDYEYYRDHKSQFGKL